MSKPIPQALVDNLLQKALSIPGMIAGRDAEGGVIPQTPYIEVSDGNAEFAIPSQGAKVDDSTIFVAVFFYERFNGAQPEIQIRALRNAFDRLYALVRDDFTLGGLCELAYVRSYERATTLVRNGTEYWVKPCVVEIRLEDYVPYVPSPPNNSEED